MDSKKPKIYEEDCDEETEYDEQKDIKKVEWIKFSSMMVFCGGFNYKVVRLLDVLFLDNIPFSRVSPFNWRLVQCIVYAETI